MLRLLGLTLILGLAAGAAGTAGAAETHPFSVDDMLAMDRISDARVSPDGTRVAFTLRTTDMEANRGRLDVYLAAVDGSWVRRMTTDPANDGQPRWSPDGTGLFFVSSRSGSPQVWRLPLDGGEAVQVTDMPLGVDALEVSPAGDVLVFSMAVIPGKSPAETREILDAREAAPSSGMVYDRLFVRHWDTWGDGTRNHLFAYRPGDGSLVDLMRDMDADCPTKPFGGSEDFTVAPDGATVVFSAKDAGRQEAWSTNYDLFVVPADGSQAPRAITTNPAWDAQPVLSPDGSTLAYLAMRRAGFEADRFDVVLRDVASGRERTFVLRASAAANGDRSPGSIAWTDDGTALLATADNLGQRSLFALDPATGESRVVVEQGTVSGPQSAAGGRILYAMNSLLGPTELYTVAADGSDVRRVTRINDDRVAKARFGTPEQFTFVGAGGDTVYGYLVRPVDFDPAQTYPVAFLVHGGPQGSFGNDFHYRWNPQAYAGAGYAAVMIDFHGSTGYGQAFTDAITGDWGGKPLEDLMKGLDAALERYPFLDGSHMGALGASYGAYMINWMAGKVPDRFRCFVTHDGNLDERMAYFDTEELWFPEWEHGGVPWENPEGYAKHNPIELVKYWKTPMLVIHGALDFRVVDTQGLSTFTALQRKGIDSRLLYFPDENHWVLKPANSVQWHQEVLGWLDRWVKER